MPHGSSYKALANERKYRYIVELPASVGGLDVALNRRIVQFHKTQHVQPRHGRTIPKEGRFFIAGAFPICRWPAPSSNSLVDRSSNLNADARRDAKDYSEHR
jgi:hypothetical protein